MKTTMILAMDENNLIGSNNDLPWKLLADLKYFKQQTLNKTILMGRKTCESLPFCLPGRRNIVLTRDKNFTRKGFEIIHDVNKVDCDIVVIGGSMIYELFMSTATELLITKIHDRFIGDTYFRGDLTKWKLDSAIFNSRDDKNLYDYSFLKYVRNKKPQRFL